MFRQLINKENNFFYLHEDTPLAMGLWSRKITEFKWEPLRPISRVVLREDSSWRNKLLSYGGRFVFIAHGVPMPAFILLSPMNPSKRIIEKLLQMFAKFFRVKQSGERGKHWGSMGRDVLSKKKVEPYLVSYCGDLEYLLIPYGVLICGISIARNITRLLPRKASHALKNMINVREEIENEIEGMGKKIRSSEKLHHKWEGTKTNHRDDF
ncbi:hypothetical protein H5410_005199 [Solanum commersonii]|uniref:Uncharacterized protein n=1 Tax=Solanum commersonii TaxID=4109 RepID=A0A9J6A5Z6_SOLCO|nr:hypothetical protein H5410_005199 [Solanum commersonii]